MLSLTLIIIGMQIFRECLYCKDSVEITESICLQTFWSLFLIRSSALLKRNFTQSPSCSRGVGGGDCPTCSPVSVSADPKGATGA